MISTRPGSVDLVSITIENFRGVRERQRFDLDGSVVLFWGPNGTGKTTVFDALLWLFQGTLPRLAAHSLRKTDEYVVSAYRPGGVASVTLEVRIAEQVVEVVRRGDSRVSNLTVRGATEDSSPEDADQQLKAFLSRGDLSLPELLATSGLLQQDDLRQMLRDKPDARYRQLLRLLGLESLEQFERFVAAEFKSARTRFLDAQADLDRQRARVNEVQEQIDTVRSLAAGSEPALAELDYLSRTLELVRKDLDVRLRSTHPRDIGAVASDVTELIDVAETAVGMLSRIPEQLPATLDAQNTLTELSQALTEEASARAEVEAASTSRDLLAATHDKLVTLVGIAIPLLQEHSHGGRGPCPVCATEINVDEVVRDLSSRSESGSVLAEAEIRLSTALDEYTKAQARVAAADAAERAMRLAEQNRFEAEERGQELYSALRQLTVGDVVKVQSLSLPPLGAPGEVLGWVHGHRTQLRSDLSRILSLLTELRTASVSALRRANAREDSISRSSQLPRLEALRKVASTDAVSRQEAYESARRGEASANALRHGAARATEEIFKERFEFIEPLMNDIYGRLDPHPTFTKLNFEIERFRSKGTAMAAVTDEAAEIHANPLLVFSSAQANVVVLSAFLALGWAASKNGLPFVLMDDPLQSLDDVNVLGFADLVGQLRTEKQVMLSTHEERFARLLEQKLSIGSSGKPLIVHRFVGWSREGPTVDTRVLSAPSPESDVQAS